MSLGIRDLGVVIKIHGPTIHKVGLIAIFDRVGSDLTKMPAPEQYSHSYKSTVNIVSDTNPRDGLLLIKRS